MLLKEVRGCSVINVEWKELDLVVHIKNVRLQLIIYAQSQLGIRWIGRHIHSSAAKNAEIKHKAEWFQPKIQILPEGEISTDTI